MNKNTMPAAAEICVVRHGETDWNLAGILQGWIDVPLNATGRQQAAALAQSYAGQGFVCVYSSPLQRALETAALIASALVLPAPLIHAGLKERNFGSVQGVPKAELAEQKPLLHQHIIDRNPAGVFTDGEAMEAFHQRVLGAISDIAQQNPGGRVLAITHGWVMDVVTRHVEGQPSHAILPLKRKNGEAIWLAADSFAIRGL